jgi:hypothetical protein
MTVNLVRCDASYLSKPKARSRVGGYFYLGNPNEPVDNPKPNGPIHVERPKPNGLIHVKSYILKNVMAGASEAEIATLFHTGQEAVHI